MPRALAADHDDELEGLLTARSPNARSRVGTALTAARCRLRRGQHEGPAGLHRFDPVCAKPGLTVTFDHPLFGEMVRAAPPVTFSETPGRVAPPCLRGQHNRTILAELGYSEDEIAKLEELNAVIAPA